MHRVLRESGGQSLLRLLRAQIAPGIGGEVRSLAARSPWLWDDTLTDGRRTTAADRAHYSKKSKGGSRDGASKAAGSAGSGADDGEAFDLEQFRGMMRKSVDHFQHELANIRMGRATPGMLDHLHVNAYGEKLPMKAVGTVSVKSSQMLAVTCFDASLAGAVASCIEESPLKLRAQIEKDGQLLVPIPAPTHETVDAMLKLCKGEAEAAKVSIRNARKLANSATRSLQSKDETFAATQSIQKLTDEFIEEVDGILKQKAKDIGDI